MANIVIFKHRLPKLDSVVELIPIVQLLRNAKGSLIYSFEWPALRTFPGMQLCIRVSVYKVLFPLVNRSPCSEAGKGRIIRSATKVQTNTMSMAVVSFKITGDWVHVPGWFGMKGTPSLITIVAHLHRSFDQRAAKGGSTSYVTWGVGHRDNRYASRKG